MGWSISQHTTPHSQESPMHIIRSIFFCAVSSASIAILVGEGDKLSPLTRLIVGVVALASTLAVGAVSRLLKPLNPR